MIEPAIEKLTKKVGSKYKLAMLITKRAKEIQKRNITEEIDPEIKEISEAAQEIYDGKIIAVDEEEE